eukprot:CAMPEP_0185908062 /NCGR_PEP_ID=MMETSP0196C-20130402/8112_1 /TAXON_ID=2932 /ORGANISM="Alexandrium fundyense, Strain CCMP1719" /LENGTH=50 /DNA_ID=CAMNT_0028628197 /DNA_START=48 /DNA_END=197 /DNA_ORIENTATION=-
MAESAIEPASTTAEAALLRTCLATSSALSEALTATSLAVPALCALHVSAR